MVPKSPKAEKLDTWVLPLWPWGPQAFPSHWSVTPRRVSCPGFAYLGQQEEGQKEGGTCGGGGQEGKTHLQIARRGQSLFILGLINSAPRCH
jgi:hypothetical protein